MAMLQVEDAKIYFGRPGSKHRIRAVDGISLSLAHGGSLGVVGESGCGKSTLANAIIGLLPLESGSIRFEGQEVGALRGAELKAFRRKVQMIFQDPFGSLNPRMTIGSAISEVMAVHGIGGKDRDVMVGSLLSRVGLDRAYAARYPHEFSGGQRQRIVIARALAVQPSVIIADEPVSALDVSVQVQILNLLKDLQKDAGLSYVFIAHDLAVVRYMCGDIAVMYLGKVVEAGRVETVLARPSHPYTVALISAVPDVERGLKGAGGRIVLKGDVPSPAELIPGCPFHPRCPIAQERCRTETPPVTDMGDGHTSVCHFAKQVQTG